LLLIAAIAIGAESGDLDDLLTKPDMRQSKAPANQPAVTEQVVDLLRLGISDDIEILGLTAQQQIPHPTADQTGAITGMVQSIQDRDRAGTDIGPRDGMFGARNDRQ